MKKSVVLAIFIIYVVSILLVGFLGGALKTYNEIIYINSITCKSPLYKTYDEVDDDIKKTLLDKKCQGYINVKYTEDLTIELQFEVGPDNPTKKKLKFFTDNEDFEILNQTDLALTLSYKGESKFTGTKLTVQADDNTGYSTYIYIYMESSFNPSDWD